jgi:hypothetical protein
MWILPSPPPPSLQCPALAVFFFFFFFFSVFVPNPPVAHERMFPCTAQSIRHAVGGLPLDGELQEMVKGFVDKEVLAVGLHHM